MDGSSSIMCWQLEEALSDDLFSVWDHDAMEAGELIAGGTTGGTLTVVAHFDALSLIVILVSSCHKAQET